MFKTLFVLAALAVTLEAAQIQWTGYANDNQWTTNNNWFPNSIPGPNDDVTIAKGTVYITIPTGVNSLDMGTDVDTPANLTLYHAFTVANNQALNVHANGNLIVNSGLEAITGTFNIDGTLTFNSGYLSGLWTISSRGTGYFPGEGQRNIAAGSLTNNGKLEISGIVGLNQSGVLINKGSIDATGSASFFVFDTSNANVDSSSGSLSFSGSIFRFQAPTKIGTFTLTSGNVEIYNQVTFANPLSIPSGSTVSSLGTASVSFPALSGGGAVVASGATTTFSALNGIAAVTAAGGAVSFTQAAQVGTLTISGGNINFGANVAGTTTNIQGGIIGGSGSVSGAAVNINTVGCNINTAILIPTAGTVTAGSLISFASSGSINVGGTLTIEKQFNVTGPAGVAGVNVSGTIAIASSETFFSQNIPVYGTGGLQIAQAGTFVVSTTQVQVAKVVLSQGSSFSGFNAALQIGSIANAVATDAVLAVLGDYSLAATGQFENVRTPSSGTPQKFAFSA